jgi:hypothetical protein
MSSQQPVAIRVTTMHLRENRRLRVPSFVRNVAAAAGINFALAAIPVLGMVGMGVDYMYGIDQRTKLQSAVDSAALAAASAWWAQSLDERKVVAEKFLLANYPETGAKLASALAKTITFGSDWVQVDGDLSVKTTLLGLIGHDKLAIGATATAKPLAKSPPCILTLENSDTGLLLNSDSAIAANCGVHVNSKNSEGIFLNSDSSVTSKTTCVTGNYRTNSASWFDPPAVAGCPKLDDPLAYLAPPPEASAGCKYTDKTVEGKQTLSPGVYCKKLELNSGADVTFLPGVYVIRDGEFIVNSGSKATGDDVLFYLEGTNNPRFNFNSASYVNFVGRRSGTYAGIVIFQARGSTADYSIINSHSSSTIEGVIYLPDSELMLNSNGTFNAASPFLSIITRKLTLNSLSTIAINNDPDKATIPIPSALTGVGAAQQVRLVK